VDGLLTWLALAGIAWLLATPIMFGPAMRRAQAVAPKRR
jgi:hypothetical protein